MAILKPFRSIRPRADIADRISALPYDVYTSAEARAEIRKEPLSFLKIDRPETNFPEGTDMYSPEVYERAASVFKSMERDGSFIQDEKDMFYLYELSMDGRSQTGIVGLSAVSDFESGVIKRHEATRDEKEQDRVRHIEALDAQTGPIFLAYKAGNELADEPGEDTSGIAEIEEITSTVKRKAPVYDFRSPDGVTHRVFLVDEDRNIRRIAQAFSKLQNFYICDGHHRMSSAVKVAEKRRLEQGSASTGNEEFEFILSVVFPSSELKIFDYNRVVKDLNSLSEDRFLDRIRKKFSVERIGRKSFRPLEKGHFGMYVSGNWYHLAAGENIFSEDAVSGLDASILQNEILAPILNIEDPKKDPRIGFVGGIKGAGAIERLVNSREYEAGFTLYPTSFKELFSVSDSGLLMPPKSTWFEPKLRSGLFIHRL